MSFGVDQSNVDVWGRGLLSCILRDSAAFDSIVDYQVSASDFRDPALGYVWGLYVDAHAHGQPTGVNDLLAASLGDPDAAKYNLQPLVNGLYDDVMATVKGTARSYARGLRQTADVRAAVDAMQDATRRLTSGEDTGRVLESARETLENVSARSSTTATMKSFDDLGNVMLGKTLDENWEAWQSGGARGIPYPYKTFTDATGGIMPGMLVLVGAETGVGKTVYAVDSIVAAVRGGLTVYMKAYEMSAEELWVRIFSCWTGIPMREIEGDCSSERLAEIKDAQERMLRERAECGGQLFINADPNGGVDTIARDCRRLLQGDSGLDLVIVDYLGIVPSFESKKDVDKYGAITTNLKRLGQTIKVPFILLAQLKRGSSDADSDGDGGTGKRQPTHNDLYGSAKPGYDSDIVITMMREESVDNTIGDTIMVITKSRRAGAGARARCISALHCSHLIDRASEIAPVMSSAPSDEDIEYINSLSEEEGRRLENVYGVDSDEPTGASFDERLHGLSDGDSGEFGYAADDYGDYGTAGGVDDFDTWDDGSQGGGSLAWDDGGAF